MKVRLVRSPLHPSNRRAVTSIERISGSLIAIDPGLNSMGWAWWSGADSNPDPDLPSRVGLLKAPRKLDLTPRALWLARELEQELDLWPSGHNHSFVCEYPAWHGDKVRMGWAAGDMQKVVFLVGIFAGYFSHAKTFTLVTPAEWKGQLPKSVVIRRLIKKFGKGATLEWDKDMWDAIGIGLWKLGRF